MRAEISEFSYGYAVVHELNSRYRFNAPPHFPSLKEEGKVGGGYDVKIDMPGAIIYLQFKVAEEMKKRSALEIKHHHLDKPPHGLVLPFYRMHLHRRDLSDQHQMLCDLNTLNPNVYYLAPRFFDMGDFTNYYHVSTILKNSITFAPKDIKPLPDDEHHHIAYPQSGGIGWLCSEPVEVEPKGSVVEIIDETLVSLMNSQVSLADTVRHELGYFIRVLDGYGVKPKWTQVMPSVPEEQYHWRMNRIEFIARTYFGLFPIVIHQGISREGTGE